MEESENPYGYIQSNHGERLTERQWAKRFIGVMAQDGWRTFAKTAAGNFRPEDFERIERVVLAYANLLVKRRGFQFFTGKEARGFKIKPSDSASGF